MDKPTAFILGLAMAMYDTYCESVGGKAFNGDPLPNSSEFFNDPTKQKQAKGWLDAAKAAAEYAGELPGSFGWAINRAKAGKKVARQGWNGKGMYLQLQTVDANSKMQHNYLYMSDVNGKFFPWNPNNLDMLAEDWCIVLKNVK